jgi:hypothetical protein
VIEGPILGPRPVFLKVPTKFELATNLNAAKCPRKTRAVRFEREGLAMGLRAPLRAAASGPTGALTRWHIFSLDPFLRKTFTADVPTVYA